MLKFGLHKRLHKFTCNNIVGISKQIVKESHTLSYCIFLQYIYTFQCCKQLYITPAVVLK